MMLRPPLSLSISPSSRSCKRIQKALSSRGRKRPPVQASGSGAAVGAGENERQRAGQRKVRPPGSTFAPSSGFTGLPEVIPPDTPSTPRQLARQFLHLPNPDNGTAILGHISLTRRWFSALIQFLLLFIFNACLLLNTEQYGISTLSYPAYPAFHQGSSVGFRGCTVPVNQQ